MNKKFIIPIFYFLLPVAAIAQQKEVSVILTRDSIKIYTGILRDTTHSYAISIEAGKPEFDSMLQAAGIQPTSARYILKPTAYTGFMIGSEKVLSWLDLGLDQVVLDTLSPAEQQYFNLTNISLPDPDLFEPMTREGDTIGYASRIQPALTLLVTGDEILYYPGKEITAFRKTAIKGQNTLATVLAAYKKQIPADSFVVSIKPAQTAGYKNIVDVLDEITVNGITQYILDTINNTEKDYFHTATFFKPLEPIEITTPAYVTSETLERFGFFVEIQKDNTTWYKIILPGTDTVFKQVEEPVLKNLSQAISTFKQTHPTNQSFFIQADHNSSFPQFERVIDALKENEIYKYSLITIGN